MRNSLFLRHSLLLSSVCVLAPAMAQANPSFYGNVTPGLLKSTSKKIDTTTTEATNVCAQYASAKPDACVPTTDDKSFSSFSGHPTTDHVGMTFQISDKVHTTVELSTMLDPAAASAVNLRAYNLALDVGHGSVIAGLQNRPFYALAHSTENMKFVLGNGQTAGTLYEISNLGISYKSNEMMGMASFHVALVNAQKPGAKAEEKSEVPTLDATVKLNLHKQVQASAGFIYERFAKISLTDAAVVDSYSGSLYGFALAGNLPGVKANLSYVMGDPLFVKGTRILRTIGNVGSVAKAKKEKINGMDLWVETSFNRFNIGGFYGMETAHLKESEGRLDKTGVAKNLDEAATAMGLHFGYQLHEGEIALEYGTEGLKYDGVSVSMKNTIGVAYNLNWAS